MALTKHNIAHNINQRMGYPIRESREILEMLLEELKLSLEEGEEVKISGFGKWLVRNKASRTGRNPYTGEQLQITARRVVTFQPSEKLRNTLNASKKRQRNKASLPTASIPKR